MLPSLLLPSIISLWVAVSPPVDAAASTQNPVSAERRTQYEAAMGELGEAEVQGDNDLGPDSCVRLEKALRDVEQYPDLLVDDAEGRETWMYARLTLVRNYYGLGNNHARAEEVLEDTLRTTVLPQYILDKFLPYFGDNVDKVRRKLDKAGKSKLEVVCHTDCSVAIDYVPVDGRSFDLYLGKHLVIVRAADGSVESKLLTLDLRKAGQKELIEFGVAPQSEPTPDPSVEPEPDPAVEPEPEVKPEPEPTSEPESEGEPTPAKPERTRKLPRWAGITGTAIGVAVAIAGAVLLSYEGKCPGGLDPIADRPDCPKVYNAKPAGYSMLIGGSVIAGTFGAVILPIGESRERRARGAQVMVTYTFRF